MDEQTANEEQVLDLGATEEVEATDVNQDDTSDATVEETNEQEAQVDASDADSTDDNINSEQTDFEDFLRTKGVDPSDPQATAKVAQMYQNAEKLMNQKAQQAAALERQLGQPQQLAPSDTLALAEVRAMKATMDAKEFKERTNLSEADEVKMVGYLQGTVTMPNGAVVSRAEMVNAGILSLDEAFKIAVGSETASAAKAELRKQVLKEVATGKNAKRPSAGATNGTQFEPTQDDPFLEGLKMGL